jgi:serine/threonine-protein kinase
VTGPTREDIARALPGYDVGGEIGRGGLGVVWSARHRRLERDVAVKELPRALSDRDPGMRARFVSEAQTLARLSHPHIVPIYDYVEVEGLCLIVMERLPAGSVWDRFVHGLSAETSCALTVTTLAALQEAHRHGVLHRDVKPQNLLFSADGVLKVTDFGIAHILGGESTQATAQGQILGTPAYIAPEQALGRSLGPPVDVFAAGVMLYELLSGRAPYAVDGGELMIVYRHAHEDPVPLRDVAPHLPGALAETVMQALARDPVDRWPTAEAFGVALSECCAHCLGTGWFARSGVALQAVGTIGDSIRLTGSGAPVAAGATVSIDGPPRPSPAGAGPEIPPLPPLPPLPGDPVPGRVPAAASGAASPPAPAPPGAGVPARPGAGGSDGAGLLRDDGPPDVRPVRVVQPLAVARVDGAHLVILDARQLGGSAAPGPGARQLDPVEARLVTGSSRAPRSTGARRRTRVLGAGALAAAVAAVAIGWAGPGSPERDAPGFTVLFQQGGRLAPEGPVVQEGLAPSDGAVPLDLGRPVTLLLPEAPAGSRAELDLSALGVPLGGSSAAEVDADGRATVRLSGSRRLAADEATAEVAVHRPDGTTVRGEVAVDPTGSPWPTLPGLLAALLGLGVIAYAESNLRTIRRSRRRAGPSVGLVATGAVLGLVAVLVGWLTGRGEPAPAGLVAAVGVGIVAGALTAAWARARWPRR